MSKPPTTTRGASRSPTAIRRMLSNGNVAAINSAWRGFSNDAHPVLVIPDNPAARVAMIERVCKALWPKWPSEELHIRRQEVEEILATALAPTPRKRRAKV